MNYPKINPRRVSSLSLLDPKQHIDTTTPTGRLVFHVLGAIDEFQRELIVEGTREGLAAARARGRTGGRKPKLNARRLRPPVLTRQARASWRRLQDGRAPGVAGEPRPRRQG